MSGTAPTFLGGAKDGMEAVYTMDMDSIMFFCHCIFMERETVFVGSSVYLKPGSLKGSFPIYESMRCQNFNPEENHIVPNKKLFIPAMWGETGISNIIYKFQGGNCIFPAVA